MATRQTHPEANRADRTDAIRGSAIHANDVAFLSGILTRLAEVQRLLRCSHRRTKAYSPMMVTPIAFKRAGPS